MLVCEEEEAGSDIVSVAATSAAEDGSSEYVRGRSRASPAASGSPSKSAREEVDVAIIGKQSTENVYNIHQ